MCENILWLELLGASKSKSKSKSTSKSTSTEYLKGVLKGEYLGMSYLVLQFVKGKEK